VEIPWYKAFLGNVREAIFARNLPPLELTSKPVPVDEIWGLYGRQRKSFLMSVSLQVGAVALLLLVGTNRTIRNVVKNNVLYLQIETPPPVAKVKLATDMASVESGGGGDRSALPASYGKLPKFALQQFAPPVAVSNNMNPKLSVEPTLIGDPDTKAPDVDYPFYGNPLSHYMTPSNGTGSGGGIGNSKGNGGVGSGSGSGFGFRESLRGAGGTEFDMPDGVTPPVVVTKVEPEYTEDGRWGRRQGTVWVAAEIDRSGHAVKMRVVRSLGLGLDEEAVRALDQWKFIPAKKDGKPLAVEIRVAVTFRLL